MEVKTQNKSIIGRLLVILLVPATIVVVLFGIAKGVVLLFPMDNEVVSMALKILSMMIMVYGILFYFICMIQIMLLILGGIIPWRKGAMPVIKRSLLLKF